MNPYPQGLSPEVRIPDFGVAKIQLVKKNIQQKTRFFVRIVVKTLLEAAQIGDLAITLVLIDEVYL